MIMVEMMGMVETMVVPTKGSWHAIPKGMMEKGGAIALTRWIEKMENALTWWNTQVQVKGREAAIDRFHELAKLVPHLVTPESSCIKRYMASLAPEIRGMLKATQPTTIQNAILRADILTDEAISCGTLSKSNEKRKAVEETGKSRGSWRDIKKVKIGAGFMAAAPPKNEFRPGHFAKDCRTPFKRTTLVNAVRIGHNRKACYQCGSPDHLQYSCPKLYLSPGQAGNPLALEGNPDFNFISTEFAPLLNVKPSIVNAGYVIEVVDGKKVEVDRIIRD
ncbi:putative reverse transcriptase domain-containing protein, partial [Tanacetum coccineum]